MSDTVKSLHQQASACANAYAILVSESRQGYLKCSVCNSKITDVADITEAMIPLLPQTIVREEDVKTSRAFDNSQKTMEWFRAGCKEWSVNGSVA